jgi:O-6-methylguanine DNA methyltransferase
MINITQFQSPLGFLLAVAQPAGLLRLDFLDERLKEEGLRKHIESRFPSEEISLGTSNLLEHLKYELDDYFLGKRQYFETPLSLKGTTFQREVWRELLKIPYGTTISYGELANRVGRITPGQSRAVANANARNPIAILVPCHRVVGADGNLTGYAGGVWRKQALLVLEGARLV